MQVARFIRKSGLWLLIGLAAFVVGCNWGAQQTSAPGTVSGAAIKEEIKSIQKERIEARRKGKRTNANRAKPAAPG
jgi:hypothetical protein